MCDGAPKLPATLWADKDDLPASLFWKVRKVRKGGGRQGSTVAPLALRVAEECGLNSIRKT